MKASWKPQVKKPSTSSTYDRWPNASDSAVVKDCSSSATALLDVSAGGVARANDNGMINSISAEKTTSAVCQPKLSIMATPTGANRNWPNEPAAVPAPRAKPRLSAGSSFVKADRTRLKEQPE